MACHRGPGGTSPVSSMAVTVKGSFVVGRDVIRIPYFQSCSSAPDVNGQWWKLQVGSKEQQTSHSQRFQILFLLFFWMVHTTGVVVLPSRLLSLLLIMTSHSDI